LEEEEEEEGEAPPPPRPPLASKAAAASKSAAVAKTHRAEDLFVRAANDVSLPKPVDPLKLVGTKVSTVTTTMPLHVQPLISRTAVGWLSPFLPPPCAWFFLAAIVQAQRPPPALGIDFHIPAQGM
jgi:hypothetical protein